MLSFNYNCKKVCRPSFQEPAHSQSPFSAPFDTGLSICMAGFTWLIRFFPFLLLPIDVYLLWKCLNAVVSWITFDSLPKIKQLVQHIFCVGLLLESLLRSTVCPWGQSHVVQVIAVLLAPGQVRSVPFQFPSLLELFPLACIICISIWSSHSVSFSTDCSSMEWTQQLGENSTFAVMTRSMATLSPFISFWTQLCITVSVI